jgi:manganese/iron transport system permease protein
MIETFLLPFQFGFMRQAFVITLLIAVPMALLSCFLVLKGWSLMGDAISHAVLPGIVVAYIVNLPLAPGSIAFLLTGRFERMLAVAVAVAAGSSFAGIYLSFFLDSAPAPTIVLIMSGLFAAAFAISRQDPPRGTADLSRLSVTLLRRWEAPARRRNGPRR